MSFVGVDGCTTGWIAVVLRHDGVEAHHLPSIAAVATAVPDAEVVAIDIPIGLPDGAPRRADLAARAFLGARRSSVFLTPVRAAVEAATHADATAAAVRQTGAGISRQAFALAPKILEVERWLPSAPCRVVEAHPEVAFRVLLGEPEAALPSKKTWAGMVARRRALAGVGLGLELDDIDETAGRAAGVDDVLDAAVIAWTARRLALGNARAFPEDAAPGSAVIWA